MKITIDVVTEERCYATCWAPAPSKKPNAHLQGLWLNTDCRRLLTNPAGKLPFMCATTAFNSTFLRPNCAHAPVVAALLSMFVGQGSVLTCGGGLLASCTQHAHALSTKSTQTEEYIAVSLMESIEIPAPECAVEVFRYISALLYGP